MNTKSVSILAGFQCCGLRIFAAILLSFAMPVWGRLGVPPRSLQSQVAPLATVERLVLAPIDAAAESEADGSLTDQPPVRYAVGQAVSVTPATHGIWEQLPDGRLWRLRIESAGATDLNLGFTTFWLPEGATLHVVAEGEQYFQGPYTARDNKPHGQLWTPAVPGEAAVIELFVPAQADAEPMLVLTQVGTGFRDLFHGGKEAGLNKSGSCNIDVVCPQASGWSNEVRSVALYSIAGVEVCTGTLIANASGDFRNFFLTADHCGLTPENAASVVVYWNFQSPSCGQQGGGSLAQNQSGAVLRAAKSDVDFALVELDEMPDPGFNVYYAGWDRSGIAPSGCVGIHHPASDEKSISFSTNTLTTVNSCLSAGGSNTHWQVIWSEGVTEHGSSGSAIWDSTTHQVVGTLSGGGSSCFSPMSPDCYGKLSVAWDSGKSSADRLSDWLDPQDTGVMSVPGMDPQLASIIIVAEASVIAESCCPTNGSVDPSETVTVSLALMNVGGVGTTNLVATLLPTAGVVAPSAAQCYGILTGGGSTISRSFSFTAEGVCGATITAVLQLQDGSRNLGTATLDLALGALIPVTILSENFDGVNVPALPAGWTSAVTGVGTAWATSTAQADTLPNALFAADPGAISDNRLTSPFVSINSADPELTFRHSYDLESGYDGGVLEISINGGAFIDILNAGGSFATNGYNRTLSPYYQNPLAERQAWSGSSGGFVTTRVNLPPAAAGGDVRLRWRLGSDNSAGASGWHLDTVSMTQVGHVCCGVLVPPLIVNPRLIEPGSFAFSYQAVAGQVYLVEMSTNMAMGNWTVVQTNTGDGSLKTFTNSTTGPSESFFRLRAQ